MSYRCIKCDVILTKENSRQSQIKNRCYICKKCDNDRKNTWNSNNRERCNATITRSRRRHGQKPISVDKNGALYLGIVVAEQVLSRMFHGVIRMPYGNPGFDFICNRGKKIDVKSACVRKIGGWGFCIGKNTSADYFAMVAFDNRESLTPMHFWMIPGNVLNRLSGTSISPSTLYRWSQYEQPLNRLVACCEALR